MRQLYFLSIIYAYSVCFGKALICERGPYNNSRFGPSCKYLCHCGGNQCDSETGECPSNVECDHGSGCTYVNITYNVPVNSPKWDHGRNIVDGRQFDCATSTNRNGEIAYLILDFGREVNITKVNLALRKTVHDFRIFLSQDNVTFTEVYRYQSADLPLVTEPKPMSGLIARFFKIDVAGAEYRLILCEVQVIGGISRMQEPVNAGVIAGTVSAVVGAIIIIMISIVLVKRRRKRNKTETDNDMNPMESTTHHMNSANADTPPQKAISTEPDKPKTYYNIEDSITQRSEPIHKTNGNSLKEGSDVSLHNGYGSLRDSTGAEDSTYSVIDHGRMDNHGSSTLENTSYYNEEFNSPERAVKS